MPAGDVTRSDYAHVEAIPTRWADNDVYGHVNNAEYYAFFDTAINAWLIRDGGLDIHAGDVIGLCAESHCTYHAAISFPDVVEAALRVGQLGRRSVRYEIALFRAGDEDAIAVRSSCGCAPPGSAIRTSRSSTARGRGSCRWCAATRRPARSSRSGRRRATCGPATTS